MSRLDVCVQARRVRMRVPTQCPSDVCLNWGAGCEQEHIGQGDDTDC